LTVVGSSWQQLTAMDDCSQQLTAVDGSSQLPLTVVNCRQPPSMANKFRYFWQRLAAVDNGWWQIMMVDEVDHCHPLWSTAVNNCQLLPADDSINTKIWRLLTVVGSSWQQLTAVDDSAQQLITAVNCHKPSLISCNCPINFATSQLKKPFSNSKSSRFSHFIRKRNKISKKGIKYDLFKTLFCISTEIFVDFDRNFAELFVKLRPN